MSEQILILAQVDDASGEVLQDVAERLHAAGARNLQVLASLGKKGRPGHVLLIDVDADLEQQVAAVLGIELGLWGYRVLESRHRHFDIEKTRRTVRLAAAGAIVEIEVGCKTVRDRGRLLGLKVEHDDLVRIRDALEARGSTVALARLRGLVEDALRESQGDDDVRILV